MAFGFLKLAHEVDDLFRRNLSYDSAGLLVYDLDHPNTSLPILVEFQPYSFTVDDQVDGPFGLGHRWFVTCCFRMFRTLTAFVGRFPAFAPCCNYPHIRGKNDLTRDR